MAYSLTLKVLFLMAFSLFFVNKSQAANCSNISSATELSSLASCKAGATGTCTLSASTTYKISAATSSSLSSLLPPIVIPSTSELCIDNSILSAPLNIFAQSFWVQGGVFQIGSGISPITTANKVTITMAGASSAAKAPKPICVSSGQQTQGSCSTIAWNSYQAGNARDITVSDGGQLLMYGVKGLTPKSDGTYIHNVNYQKGTVDGTALSGDINQKPYFNTLSGSNSWTYLRYPAGPGYFNNDKLHVQAPVDLTNFTTLYQPAKTPATTASIQPVAADAPYLLALSNMVTDGSLTDWKSGDWVSVSTTTFSGHETEMLQICEAYAMQNPDPALPSGVKSKYDDVTGPTALPFVTVLVLAGAPSYTSKCTDLTATPLKHYHFGSSAPTPGYFSADTSYTNTDSTTFNAKKGQAYSLFDGESNNFGIDERAEVALLSRSIKLTAATNTKSLSPISNLAGKFFGGHIAIMNHDTSPGSGSEHADHTTKATAKTGTPAPTTAPTTASTTAPTPPPPDVKVELVGVEIEKFGQPFVGRYPIHFHLLNMTSPTTDSESLLVQDSTVHHSFNKCFVTHDSKGVQFYNNTCVRTIGQGVYLEDGHNVAGNNFIRNLVAGTMAAELNYTMSSEYVKNGATTNIGKNTYWDGDYLAQQTNFNYNPVKVPDASDSGANTGNYIDSFTPGGFWITTFGDWDTTSSKAYPNVFVNNSVAGCQMGGSAYWLVRQDVSSISDVPSTKEQDLYPVFTGNRGHGCYNGLVAATDFAILNTPESPIGPAPKPVPVSSDVSNSAKTPFVIFDGITMTQIENKAMWYRGVFVGVNNGRFSALKQGMTLLGGGGPEGNLLGFWGLVHNSVFAGVTNNNVGRYSDCEGYNEQIGSGAMTVPAKTALPIQLFNEMTKCAPINMTSVSNSPLPAGISNNSALFGAIVTAFNFQGYTFYDGPARMEDNRFVNFRADPTNPTLYNNVSDTYSGTRYLTTTADAYRMKNFSKAGQFADVNYEWGADSYYGAEGDAAFSWLKGNQQSVPPTQYATGNLWDNVNFKHQVFTEISNLQPPLQDGDKQTVEIDKDTTLSGYTLCGAGTNSSTCSTDTSAKHFPLSLNNLDVFATAYTVDEPHTRGRNNIVSSALMSPHKYATVNVGVAEEKPITTLTVHRDMLAYSGSAAETSMTGRGGKPYMYEAMVMNNMGYTYSTADFKPSGGQSGETQLIFSYSDAPVDTNFINRVGICVGAGLDATIKPKIYKNHRQWNSGVNYLASSSPYWKTSQYGLTDTSSTCPALLNEGSSNAYSLCQTNGTEVSTVTQAELNSNYYNVLDANYSFTDSPNFSEGYYYDSISGILYFNMMQSAQSTAPLKSITPPFGTCDSANYVTGSKTRQAVVDYLLFSNADSISSTLDTGCYAASGTPVTSELLTCPTQGCAVYTVGFTLPPGGNAPSCSASSWAGITNGAAPSLNVDNSVTYSAPYVLYNQTATTPLAANIKTVSVNVKGQSSTLQRNSHYLQGGVDSTTIPTTGTVLPLAVPVYITAPANPLVMDQATPDNVTVLTYGQPTGSIYTLATGASGQSATITEKNNAYFSKSQSPYTQSASLSINTTDTLTQVFYYSGTSASMTIGSENLPCTITFANTAPFLTLGNGAGCSSLSVDQASLTITVNPYIPAIPAGPLWYLITGASPTAGQNATLKASGKEKFVKNNPPTYSSSTTVSVSAASSGNSVAFYYSGSTATIKIGSKKACTLTFSKGKVSGPCPKLKITPGSTTMTVQAN